MTKETAHTLFHKLWTATVGGPAYNKNEWKELETKLVGNPHATLLKAEECHRFGAHGDSEYYCCLAPNREKE